MPSVAIEPYERHVVSAGGDSWKEDSMPDLAHAAGAFVGPDGKGLPVPEGLPNAHMRLFGGAQYHRCAQCICSVTS